MAKTKETKSGTKQYAVWGLWLSALAFVALLVVGAMKAFEIIGFYTPTDATLIPRLLWGTGGAVVIGLALFAMLDPNRALSLLTGRQAKHGSNALITSIAFIGILVFANVIVYQNPPQPWDLTAGKENTLAPETLDALQKLPEAVKATAFFSQQFDTTSAKELLEQYRTNSKGKFTYEFIDPDRNPLAAQDAGITGDGKILLEMGAAREIIPYASENELTAGFIRLLNPEKLVVYFLTGEGEHNTEQMEDGSYTRIKQALESKNYVVKTLNLEAEKIPDDAKVIVLAGPRTPLSSQAVEALKTYLTNGGSLIAMENPLPLTNFGDKKDLFADYMSSDWGVTLNNDVVIDTQSPTSPINATAYQYSQHPITENMGGVGVTFPFARSLSIALDKQDVTAQELILTSEAAWGETDFASIEANQPGYDPQTEQAGPIVLAAAAENSATGARVFVTGNSGFAIDDNFDYSGNGDLLVNAIDWGASKEELISLTIADSVERTFVAPGNFQRMIMFAGAICLIPLAIIIMGVSSWYARKKQG